MKIFNKQRFKNMGGTNFKKYLGYAIGEIILVVVGILIAIGINKWQEGERIMEERTVLASQVYQQMVKDTTNIWEVIVYNKNTGPIYDKVLRNTEPGEPILGCLRCSWLLQGNLNIANTDNKVLSLLRNANYGKDSLSSKLRRIEEIYTSDIKILNLLEERIVDNLANNYEELLEKYPWFTEYLSRRNCNSECQKYFMESQDFRRRVALIEMLVIRAYNSELTGFNQSLGQQLADLDTFDIN